MYTHAKCAIGYFSEKRRDYYTSMPTRCDHVCAAKRVENVMDERAAMMYTAATMPR